MTKPLSVEELRERVRLTVTQETALRQYLWHGDWHHFGEGSRKYAMSLRALHRSAPALVERRHVPEGWGHREEFRITDAGLASLQSQEP